MRRVTGWLRGALLFCRIGACAVVLSATSPARASSALDLVNIARAHEAAHEEDLALRRYTEALALDHLPQLRAARIGRAHVRRALGARAEAIDDLLTGAEDDPAALRILAGWYGEEGQTPAQLAVWRRIVARAEATQDALLLHEARNTVKALLILVGPADPAAQPATDDKTFRRFVALLARKGA
jgi:hypothetical protein